MHSSLLSTYLIPLKKLAESKPVLDLACGSGRNGLYLIQNAIPTVFADINPLALKTVKQSLLTPSYYQNRSLAELCEVDFEQAIDKVVAIELLKENGFAAVMVFRYLHRALFDKIKQAIIPGGMVIYETFTLEQIKFGRPTNPNFLLERGELSAIFSDWEIVYYFEGVVDNARGDSKQAIAQLVAIKPLST